MSPQALLGLIRLASPALPVGGFSHSEGFEAAVEAGLAGTEQAAGDWLVDQLHLVVARAELPVMIEALAAWRDGAAETIAPLNDWVRLTRESAELRLQTEQMGRSMVEWLRHAGHAGSGDAGSDPRVAALAALAPAPTWPVAFALAAARTGADPRDAGLAFAFGWAENAVQAATRSVPLGQNAAQRVLGRIAAEIPQAVEGAVATAASGIDVRQAHAPMLAVLSAQHETQYSRLFRS